VSVNCIPFELPDFRIRSVGNQEEQMTVVAEATGTDSACPHCGVRSSHVHSYYTRHVQDLPRGGKAVHLVLRIRLPSKFEVVVVSESDQNSESRTDPDTAPHWHCSEREIHGKKGALVSTLLFAAHGPFATARPCLSGIWGLEPIPAEVRFGRVQCSGRNRVVSSSDNSGSSLLSRPVSRGLFLEDLPR
jgi:hypothetical protein